MRGQSHRNYCGPATIANLLRALGISRTVTEDHIAKVIKLGNDLDEPNPALGTLEGQILKVLKKYRLKAEQFCVHQPHPAICCLRDNLRLGRPVILVVDDDSHWLLAIGVLGTRIVIVDSADPEVVVVYSETELSERWGSATDPAKYYALVAHPKGGK